ncbi:MAG: sialate O-acetylesterase [Verrucomicrobiota bacterium]
MKKGIIILSAFLAAGFLQLPIAAAEAKPLKIFILAGQSNMQGHAHISTMDVMAMDPRTAPILEQMRNEDGTPVVCDRVWISSIGSSEEEKTGKLTVGFGPESRGPKIGPELTFGIYMEQLLDEPILIIKTAWGGKSVNTDFRPPSAPPYEFNETQLENFKKQGKDIAEIKSQKAEASGKYYKLMVEHVKHVLGDIKRVYPDYNAEQGHELAGFVWFQGWNDMVDRGTYPNRDKPGGYDQYSVLLAQMIRDLRKDLEVPQLPVVIGVIGVNGPTSKYGPDQMRYKGVHQNIRDAMAAPALLPEFKGNVAAVLTENYWDMDLSALRKRDRELKPQLDEIRAKVKEKTLSREEGDAAQEKLYADNFSDDELKLLRNGASNAEYHYMGSAKIMGQIGKAFAESMNEILNAEN